jgi:hypothetical protein
MFAPTTRGPRAQTLNNSNRTTIIGFRYAAFLASRDPPKQKRILRATPRPRPTAVAQPASRQISSDAPIPRLTKRSLQTGWGCFRRREEPSPLFAIGMDCENSGGECGLGDSCGRLSQTNEERVCYNLLTVHGQMRWVVGSCSRIWALAACPFAVH